MRETSASAESLKKKIQGAFGCQHKIVKEGFQDAELTNELHEMFINTESMNDRAATYK